MYWVDSSSGELIDMNSIVLKKQGSKKALLDVSMSNTICRIFPDGTVQFRILPLEYFSGMETLDKPQGEPDSDNADTFKRISCYKSKQLMFDIARSNDWNYFVTLTYDPDCVDRYDYNEVYLKTKSFMRYLTRHGCHYLLIPELHKDGAIHVHGLIRGPLPVQFSGHYDKQKRPVYNAVGYRLGWSHLTKVDNQARVSTYMTKYVTKELLSAVPFGRRRFWATRGLLRPEMRKLYISPQDVQSLICSMEFNKVTVDVFGNEIILAETKNVNDFVWDLAQNVQEISVDDYYSGAM